ncbi:hypothetical protein K432DRAFT_340288, partial [Lepidopterella palustris CBS 459.81]
MAISENQQMEALLRGLDKILYLIGRCEIYDILYIHNPKPTEALETLKSAMIQLYAIILRFLAKEYQQLNKSTASRAFHALLNPDDVAGFEKDTQASERRIESEAGNCERSYNRAAQAEGVPNAEKFKALLQEMKIQNDVLVEKDTELWDRTNAEERRKILQWTSDIPCQDNHELARQGRTPDTGEWLLNHIQYQNWRSANESMILWLHGVPGAGKTKLVSKVVDDLIDHPRHEALAYFYCDCNQGPRREPENILRSFVKQLSFSPKEDAIHHCLVQIYHQKERGGFPSNKITCAESERLLLQLIEAYQHTTTTLIVDALDECDANLRGELIEAFHRLIAKSKKLKIFISSRRDDDIKNQLEEKTNVGIEATDNHADISKFVVEAIRENEKERRIPIPVDLQQEIIHTLSNKSQGVFQWASLQIGQVLSLTIPDDIRNCLGKLPSDLKNAYDEIYSTIQNQLGSQPEIANRAFQLVMCSYRPLFAAELVAAVCQDPDSDEPKGVDIDIHFVLHACRNLLVVDERLNSCRFAHLSVQEYFEDHWSAHQANGLVARVCLSLLNYPDHWDPNGEAKDSEKREDLSQLISYARNYWPIHVQRCGETDIDKRVSALLQRFLGGMNQSGPAYRSWYEMYVKDETPDYRTLLGRHIKRLQPPTSVSLAICLFGFCGILSAWWEFGFMDIEETNEHGDSLLVLAALGGSVTLVGKLLQAGANVNAQGGDYGN